MDSIRANLKKGTLLSLLFSILILVLLAIIPCYVSGYYTSLLTQIFMYMILAISWTMFSGPTGYISLSSGAYLGIGMYFTAVLGDKLPLPLVILLGGFAASLLAFWAGLATLRIRGLFFGIFTLGLNELLKHTYNWWEVTIARTHGRVVISIDLITCFYAMLIILIITLLSAYIIRRSKFGLALRSIGENEEAAGHTGVNLNSLKIITYAFSAFWMGVTGATYVTQMSYITSDVAFNLWYSFVPVLMSLFGGTGQIYGPILGAAFFTLLENWLITEFPYYYMLIFGLAIAGVVMFMPSGLGGLIEKRREGRLVE